MSTPFPASPFAGRASLKDENSLQPRVSAAWSGLLVGLIGLALGLALHEQGVAATALAPNPTPTATLAPASLVGRLLQTERGETYRLMEDGRLRQIPDMATLAAFGYAAGERTFLASSQARAYPLGLPLTRWLAAPRENVIFFMRLGRRYRLPDVGALAATGGALQDVSLVPESFLSRFPEASDPLLFAAARDAEPGGVTGALWAGGELWVTRADATFRRWKPGQNQAQEIRLPDRPIISSLEASGGHIFASTRSGELWALESTGQAVRMAAFPGSRLVALTAEPGPEGALWYADTNQFDLKSGQFHAGRVLIRRDGRGQEQVFTLDLSEHDPLKSITALAFDSRGSRLWIGTRFAGVLSLDLTRHSWERYTTLNTGLPDNHINALSLALDGSLWVATPVGVAHYVHGEFERFSTPDDVTNTGALALAAASDQGIWVAGENYVARLHPDGKWQLLSAFDHPALLDSFIAAVLDDGGQPWFIGQSWTVHWDGQGWLKYDTATFQAAALKPPARPGPAAFPSPKADYVGWLRAWPRPQGDNGRGLHFLTAPPDNMAELRLQVERLRRLGVRWTVVNYTGRYQLLRAAPIFAKAGITVVWRPFVRPYQEYAYWAQDITFLRALNLPPYIQVYNEPSLGQEWEDAGRQVDQALYLRHLLPAIRQVVDAGGYAGLQEIDLDWLRVVLRRLKEQPDADAILQRMFFIPHTYGYNRPPAFDKHAESVLGFRFFARVFSEEIGFVPVMIAGEGGWRPGEAQDRQFPAITEALHRDYLLAVFDWFRAGMLSNGEPLPDYLLAFCPWLLADPTDPAAWFDSTSGDRSLVIQAVEKLPAFERRFSWEKP